VKADVCSVEATCAANPLCDCFLVVRDDCWVMTSGVKRSVSAPTTPSRDTLLPVAGAVVPDGGLESLPASSFNPALLVGQETLVLPTRRGRGAVAVDASATAAHPVRVETEG
jgi:hypothetical protein